MMLDPAETICAIASPPGEGLRGIIRVSGPGTFQTLARIFTRGAEPSSSDQFLILQRSARAGVQSCAVELGEPLGSIGVRVSYWLDQRSYTGQPAAELHTIGAGPILEAIVEKLLACGARIAMPGEFTLRAFLAGKIDLIQAEAVLGVIQANRQRSLGVALDQLTGGISSPLKELREEMLVLLADVEAGLDFVDEDIEFIASEVLIQRLESIGNAIQQIANRMRLRRRSSELPTLVLWGPPNAGKSTLLNALSGSRRAIVSDVVGTTRDPVEATVEIAQSALRVIDTAGVEDWLQTPVDSANPSIAQQAQEFARNLWEQADIRVWCSDASEPLSQPPGWILREGVGESEESSGCLRVATKCDRIADSDAKRIRDQGWLLVSTHAGVGLADLSERLIAFLETRNEETRNEETGTVGATAMRCHASLSEAAERTRAAARLAEIGEGDEWVAAELRSAIEAIGEVTGQVYTEEILDRIFSRFCIGK